MRIPGERLSGWRKIANAVWSAPNDPQIYGLLEIDATAIQAFLRASRARGLHMTPTHLVGRAIAHALEAAPALNARILVGRSIPRPSIDVFFITAMNGGHDLSGVKIARASEKSAGAIAEELRARSEAMKQGRDPDLARAKQAMERLPLPLLRLALRGTAWLAGDLGWGVRALGLDASPFGSAMVSSVGMLGIPVGFSPLAWMYKVPLLVLVGAIADKAVAVDGRVAVRPILPITATIDHRYADGWQIAQAMNGFREYLAAPERFEPALGAPATPSESTTGESRSRAPT
jgi:pyruvate dehydrogenase E2 component (dihydrolipoamide acetyltransferase)